MIYKEGMGLDTTQWLLIYKEGMGLDIKQWLLFYKEGMGLAYFAYQNPISAYVGKIEIDTMSHFYPKFQIISNCYLFMYSQQV